MLMSSFVSPDVNDLSGSLPGQLGDMTALRLLYVCKSR